MLKNKTPWLSLGKIWGSWGEVPKSIGAYSYPGSLYFQGNDQWNGNFQQFTNASAVDPKIHGAVGIEKVVGASFFFLKSRVGFTVAYTDKINKEFPNPLPTTLASGQSTLLTNVGEINFSGLDVTFNVKPIWSKNFKWELNATYANTISNKIIDIDNKPQSEWKDFPVYDPLTGVVSYPKRPVFSVETATFGPRLLAIEGEQWGQLYGTGIKRDKDGNALINANGTYVYDANTKFGSVLPDYTGGVQSTLTLFRDFTVSINVDFQHGGKYYSTSDKWGKSTGVLAATAVLNDKGIPVRDPVANGGGVHIYGVDAVTLKPVNMYVNARDYFNGSNNTFDNDIYDLTFVKLRELAVGYNVPVSKLGIGKWVKKVNFSVVASNPWLIYAKTRDFDPSEISRQSGEGGQFPGLRGVGVNLKLGF